MQIRTFVALFLAFAFSSAANTAEPWKLPKTKEECLAKKGTWGKRGMPGDPKDPEICFVNAPDAGKQCTSQVECLSGWCRPKDWKPAGEKALGTCEAFAPVNGCVQGLDKGIIFNIPCVI
jgi:hypothetical protein